MTFRYLGKLLDQTDDYWPAVWQNTIRARPVKGGLGTLIRREGADTRLKAMFYRTVVQ